MGELVKLEEMVKGRWYQGRRSCCHVWTGAIAHGECLDRNPAWEWRECCRCGKPVGCCSDRKCMHEWHVNHPKQPTPETLTDGGPVVPEPGLCIEGCGKKRQAGSHVLSGVAFPRCRPCDKTFGRDFKQCTRCELPISEAGCGCAAVEPVVKKPKSLVERWRGLSSMAASLGTDREKAKSGVWSDCADELEREQGREPLSTGALNQLLQEHNITSAEQLRERLGNSGCSKCRGLGETQCSAGGIPSDPVPCTDCEHGETMALLNDASASDGQLLKRVEKAEAELEEHKLTPFYAVKERFREAERELAEALKRVHYLEETMAPKEIQLLKPNERPPELEPRDMPSGCAKLPRHHHEPLITCDNSHDDWPRDET